MSILAFRNIWPQIPEDVFVAPGAWIIGDVVIGSRSSVWFNTVIRGDVNFIRIGEETNVQDNCSLHVTTATHPLHIGSRVVIGHSVVLHGCTVEDDCLIGIGAIVLDGAKVGKGSLVAAGTLVPPGFEVPPDSVVMGSPAEIKRTVTETDREAIRYGWISYLKLVPEYVETGALKERKIEGFLR